jgi:general secretion pathway protein G
VANKNIQFIKLGGNMHFKGQRGFSLIEIMVVIVIMGLLLSVVGPQVIENVNEARIQTVRSHFGNFKTALDSYRLDNYRYPTTEQGLDALMNKPSADPEPKKWRQYMDKLPKDPWQNDYIYISPGDNGKPFDIQTLGADGVRGGEDPQDVDRSYWDDDGAAKSE